MAIAPHMRLTGRLLCVCLFSVLAVADIVPSNSSSAVRNFNGVVELVSSNASKNLSRLVPLTQKAATGVVVRQHFAPTPKHRELTPIDTSYGPALVNHPLECKQCKQPGHPVYEL